MAIGVAEKGNVYDLRGLSTEKSLVDTSKIGVGTTYFEIDTVKVYMWNGTAWAEL